MGERNSQVFGSIIDGVFEGKIISSKDAFYIENAKHYFPNNSFVDYDFHSIIYNENHVNDPYENVREGECFFFVVLIAFNLINQYPVFQILFVICIK